MGRTRVLLAEDYAPVAEQLRALLAAEFDVVAVVADGFALLGAARELAPDVVVTDIAMPGLDGLTAATRILHDHPHPAVVVVTVHNEPALVKQAFEAGVDGYVLKVTAGEELIPAVHAALRAERFASPLVFGGAP